MQRLDKYLADAGVGSRKELKALIRSGTVTVDGAQVRDESQQIDEKAACVLVRGVRAEPRRTLTLMLHKPAGYVTSTEDPRDPTVMELLPPQLRRWDVVPVGRLDKQTEGLLLLTNDGALAHRLISPKYEVEKEYYAEHEGICTEEDVRRFAEGLMLRDGTVCRKAQLSPLGEGRSLVTVTEGKYHQVRRMLAACGHPVTYLRREREGGLRLGNLPKNEWRELTETEIRSLFPQDKP